jgi:predicted esterase
VLAFSPGFMAPEAQRGQPAIFISHGTHDNVLPIEKCSRRIVPQLKRAGYQTHYREFDGPHTVPDEIQAEAAAWWPGNK